jgi:hypothetical protein
MLAHPMPERSAHDAKRPSHIKVRRNFSGSGLLEAIFVPRCIAIFAGREGLRSSCATFAPAVHDDAARIDDVLRRQRTPDKRFR